MDNGIKEIFLVKKKISFKLLILGRGIKKKELETFIEHNELNKNVKIIEKSSTIGGLARTESWKGKPIDMGPHIYHTPDDDIKNYLYMKFIGRAEIVFSTLSSTGLRILSENRFNVCLIDEAAQSTEPESLLPISKVIDKNPKTQRV